MAAAYIHIWRKNPFLRILLSLLAGIIIQWNIQLPLTFLWVAAIVFFLLFISLFFIPFFDRFRFSFLSGLAICTLFIAIGALLTWYKDIRHDKHWFGNYYKDSDKLVVTINEPLVEKIKSFKADATVDFLWQNENAIPVRGKIILYFKKDSLAGLTNSTFKEFGYGTQIIINKPLQEIKNSGNPGGFDYKRYSLFNKITHQVYLKPGEFTITGLKNEKWFDKFVYASRKKVLNTLRRNIQDEKELGLAEALLIGYKNDLDQNLVQSYTNTGVVHIIAISGLHLGLIYWLLIQLFRPLQNRKKFNPIAIGWLRPLFILTGLWLFSLLAGGQASVIRSAVMFTCIVIGEGFSRKTSIYNTLAFSAFLLLCYNPFWLWDVGFQLSYAAVLSIVIFMRPIYNWLYVRNKLLDFIWKLNAVTLAAQILTVPLSIYHFHQFPNYFVLTNFVAVPLSSIIVLGEILLCTVSFVPFIALLAGKILSFLIWVMNSYIERIQALPYSLLEGLQINITQTILLVLFIAGTSFWLMEKITTGLKIGLIALFGFVGLRSWSFMQSKQQQKVIVYNVPQQQAVDIIDGRKLFFIGDTDLVADNFVTNFHLKPSRILYRTAPATGLSNFEQYDNLINYKNKKILIINDSSRFALTENKLPVDLLIVSGNPKLYFSSLIKTFSINQVVFDGKCPSWKITFWKKDCDSLHIPYHDVNEKGAFVMNLR